MKWSNSAILFLRMYPSWNRCLRTWHGNSKSSVTCNVYDPRPEPMAIWPGLLSSWMWFQLDLNQLVCTLICKVWSRCLQCYFRFYHGLYVLPLPAMKKDELCLKTEIQAWIYQNNIQKGILWHQNSYSDYFGSAGYQICKNQDKRKMQALVKKLRSGRWLQGKH